MMVVEAAHPLADTVEFAAYPGRLETPYAVANQPELKIVG
jgi:hypothetical protein